MGKVVGVRFKKAGKIYDFDCGAFVLSLGMSVIVETEQHLGFGIVASEPVMQSERKSKRPLKKVFRVASKEDFDQREKNIETEKDAYAFCLECVKKLNLKMSLFSVESTFDTAKLIFFFTADGRIDFRQLVKMLVKKYKKRIEMRQVGIRNHAKICGGIGRCGRVICCSAFIETFQPVSIKMAKDQGLSLNPTKISGQCGRLMCCLTFEDDAYRYLKKKFPKIGQKVKTDAGTGRVIRQNLINSSVLVKTKDNLEIKIPIDEIDYDD